MIKYILFCLALLVVYPNCYAQDSLLVEDDTWEPGCFCLSANPYGLALYGPIINAELILGDRFRINSHVRFPSAGFLSWAYSYGADNIKGLAVGGGLLIDIQKKTGTPYVGILMEYDHHTNYYKGYDESLPSQYVIKFYAIGLSTGYRWRFNNGAIINLGLHLFIKTESNIRGYQWHLLPLPYPDVSFGYEFGRR